MTDKRPISLCYYLADQVFGRTKSVGIWNVSLELAKALANHPLVSRIEAIINREQTDHIQLGGGLVGKEINTPTLSKFHRLYFDQIGLYRLAAKTGAGALFLPKGFASFCAKPPKSLYAYVHDIIPFEYARSYPGHFSHFELTYFQKSMLATFRHATKIFTNSAFSKSEIQRIAAEHRLSVPDVRVVGIGFDVSRKIEVVKRNHILVLVGRAPHKNSKQAIDYVLHWHEQLRYDGEVFIVGDIPVGATMPKLSKWHHLPRSEEGTYRQIFDNARVVVYFSKYEGFGMPVAEALVRGVCPVCSDIPATREIIGESKWLFANDDFQSFGRAMTAALEARGQEIRKAADKVAARWSWRAVAERVVNGIGSGNDCVSTK